jgi:hypothetical protein
MYMAGRGGGGQIEWLSVEKIIEAKNCKEFCLKFQGAYNSELTLKMYWLCYEPTGLTFTYFTVFLWKELNALYMNVIRKAAFAILYEINQLIL